MGKSTMTILRPRDPSSPIIEKKKKPLSAETAKSKSQISFNLHLPQQNNPNTIIQALLSRILSPLKKFGKDLTRSAEDQAMK